MSESFELATKALAKCKQMKDDHVYISADQRLSFAKAMETATNGYLSAQLIIQLAFLYGLRGTATAEKLIGTQWHKNIATLNRSRSERRRR